MCALYAHNQLNETNNAPEGKKMNAMDQKLKEIEEATAKMVAATIASGQVQLIGGFNTREEAQATLPPFTTFQVCENIAGRFFIG